MAEGSNSLLARILTSSGCDPERLKTLLYNLSVYHVHHPVVRDLFALPHDASSQEVGKILLFYAEFEYIQPADDDNQNVFSPVWNCTSHPTDYFLHIASEQRLIYSRFRKRIGNVPLNMVHLCERVIRKRIVDVPLNMDHPCERAIYINSPQLLFVLLKHGSGLFEPRFFFKRLIVYLYLKIHDTLMDNEVPKCELETYPKTLGLIRCVQYILRVCPAFNYSDEINIDVLFKEPVTRYVPPSLSHLTEKTCQPSSLLHLNRLTIRKRLHENWHLPAAIQNLHLPNKLKNYLNIMED